jgi:hypothetical protein
MSPLMLLIWTGRLRSVRANASLLCNKRQARRSLAVGTAIATFDAGGHYPNNAHGNHAAIYLGQDAQGIRVVDQWVDRHGIHRSPAIRVLKFDDTKGASDNGNKFNVVE